VLTGDRWDVRGRLGRDKGGRLSANTLCLYLPVAKTRDGRPIPCVIPLPPSIAQMPSQVTQRIVKVDFDSVFNQSSHTFSFGSPDILPMFVQGATPGRVEGWSYCEEDEDFTKGTLIPQHIYQCSVPFPLDATALDIWVLDQLKSLFRNATMNKELEAQLRAPQVVFFLHLLGLDTTGHSYRPHSKVFYVHAIFDT